MLMEDVVRVNSTCNMVSSIWARCDGPLKVGLVSMSVSIPDGNLGIIFGSTSLQVGNSIWGESTDKVELLSLVGELFGFSVSFVGFNWNEGPFEVSLVNIVPLGDGVTISMGSILDMYAFSRMSKSDRIPISTFMIKVNLQVSLVSMSVLVPN